MPSLIYTFLWRFWSAGLIGGFQVSIRYWWVNQNQTFTHEVTGGYLWSPKKRSDGGRNQFYDNMQAVQMGDIVFSFADTYIKAVGIATGQAFTSPKPKIFGQAGSNWAQEGWQVPVDFLLLENQLKPKNHMHLLGALLPSKYSPLTADGNGLQGVYLAELPVEMGSLLMKLTAAPELTLPVTSLHEISFNPEEQEIIADISLEETQKATLVMARRGQGIFRNRVRMVEKSCRVTGVTAENFLIASHIKPWKDSDNLERLDGNNGLFLSPHVDKLFDSGFISFSGSGSLLVSPLLDNDVLSRWSIEAKGKYGKFNGEQSYFLEYHNQMLFKAS
jgi:hypothetical protein